MAAIDPSLCPLCGGANQCGAAAGKGTCWCFSHPIPQEIIDAVPIEARELACICATCAFGQRDAATTLERMKEILRGRG